MVLPNLLHHRTRHSRHRRQPPRPRLLVELLEARNLLDGGLANVLVNNAALDTTAQDTQSETAIVLGAGSKVIVAYNDSVSMVPGDYYHGTGYSRSADGGQTFTELGPLAVNSHHDQGDPVLARSAKTGTVFLATLSVDNVSTNPNPPPPLQWSGFEQVNVYRSTNNGGSFRQPANGTPGFDAAVDGQDKPWIAVDNFPGPGYGNVYLVNLHYSVVPGNLNTDIQLTRSTDDGLTWGPSGGTVITSAVMPKDFLEGPNVAVGPDHAVYVSWWQGQRGAPAEILMSKSTDGGVTFSDPVTVTRLNTFYIDGDLFLTDSSGHYFGSNAFPQAAVNPVTGDIYVAYDDWGNAKGTDRGDIYFTESTDGGRKWSKPVQVNDDLTNNDQWFPALSVTPDGSHVGLFWYDRRLDPANDLIDRFGAIATVSGHTVTFGENFRITDVSFPPVFTYWTGAGWAIQDPVTRPGYMGDYDMATADNNYFYTTWGDNRLADASHVNQPDVRFAKIPVGWEGTDSTLAALAGPGGAFAARPAMADGTPLALPPDAAAVAVAEPGAPLSRAVAGNVLTVDAYFIDLARTSQNKAGVTNGDPARQHTFGLAAPALPIAREPVVPPPTRLTDTPTPALARGASQRPADGWATDVLISDVLWWDGEAGM